MSPPSRGELPIIQATMDLIQWFVPLLNRLPRDQRFALGDELVQGLNAPTQQPKTGGH
jgi:hypothetical protein